MIVLRNARFWNGKQWLTRTLFLFRGRLLTARPSDFPRSPKTIDLSRAWLLPAFADAHAHIVATGQAASRAQLSTARNETQAVSLLRKYYRKPKRGQWLIGEGWALNDWRPSTLPSRRSLDRYFPRNPVVLKSRCGHLLWLNTTALTACRVSSLISRYPLEIKVDKQGQPTGVVSEDVNELVWKKVPSATARQRKQFILQAMKLLNQKGITAVHAPEEAEDFSLFLQLRDEGKLTGRILFYVPYDFLPTLKETRLKSGDGDSLLKIGGVKIFLDGSLGGRTAAMKAPYDSEPENQGILCWNDNDVQQMILEANRASLSVAIHCIGDAAVAQALRCLNQAAKKLGRTHHTLQNRLEHAQLFDPRDLTLLSRLKLPLAIQPGHILLDRDSSRRLWGRRARYAFAFRTLASHKALLCSSSDAPVLSPDPLRDLAFTHWRRLPGEPTKRRFFFTERLSMEDAYRASSLNPYSLFGDTTPPADLLAFNRNPFTTPLSQWPELSITHCFFNGELLWTAEHLD